MNYRAPLKRVSKIVMILTLAAFISVAFFGITQSTMGMEKKADDTMGGCLLTGMEEICKMSFTAHLTEWQSIFNTTVTQNAFTIILLLLLAVVVVSTGIFKRSLLLLFSRQSTHWRLYLKYNPELSLFNPVKVAFARGILNPKIY